jgi:glycerol-3-phosphate O-acyltransferase
MMSKIMNHLVEGLHVDRKGLEKINEMVSKNRKIRIVFMPIYKSYSDPLVLHYLNFFADLNLGFTFGNYEDSPKIGFVERLLKRIGTILIRRNPQNSLANATSTRIDLDVMNYVNQSLF